MDPNIPDILRDPGGPGLTAGPSSQRSISHSLQRAEVLLRSTFNPSLKWLFHGRSEDEEVEEQNFVVAHNLASRSSARLLRLQQALLTVAPQWQLVGGAQMGSPQVCVKGLPAEGDVLLLPSSSSLQKNYRALWRLLEQRSLLIFIHEYTRRTRIAAAYVSRVCHLLEKSRLTLNQAPSNWSSLRVGLGSLSQELRIHLNHWSCLFSKVQSDQYLRPALVRHTNLLVEIKQTLDLLGLQALVLMESYVYVVLSAVARTKLDSVPREVLEDVLAGTDLYNQAVWERAQHSSTQLRTTVLQLAHYSTLDCSLTNRRGHCIAAFSVKELMMILALHHADRAAKQLHCWASDPSCHCQVHTNHMVFTCSDTSQAGTATLRSESTWDQLQHTYLMYSPLFSTNHLPPLQSSSGTESSNQDQSSPCQTCISHTGLVQSSVEPLVSVQPNLERQTGIENCKLLQTLSPPLSTSQHLSAQPLSGVCQQAFLSSSVELLFQLLVSSSDLLAPHTPKPVAPTEQLLTDVLSPNGKSDTIINIAGSVELNRLSTEQNKEQHVEGTQQEWREVEATASSGCQRDGDPEREETVRAERTAVQPDCHQWPHSVQWLDLGQSLVYADLFGQYRTLLWTLCSKALWLQLHVPQTGNSAGSINLQDSHTRFQILHRISQASDTVLCRSLGSALKDKCLTDINQRRGVMTRGVMSVTMEHFVLLSSLCCLHSDSRASGFPTSPSEYASLAAQTVIGQVLEGVAPLSDDACVQALSITMTAFMEAWMEHILKHKIKFSVQGALQLKQDFDSIKELIQLDKYGPANRSRDSIDAVVGNSITNLRCMEGEDLTQSDPSVVTTDLSPVDQSNPGEPYLAPSLALGSAQQDWLDLRIHSSTRRWRLPGLQCLSKSEP
ncbi:Coiled-coil domain-containing protein 142 [Collichthys lucidus]|uniref:Coiled-coil domain-containing protein 142 n=1 Tax=Collichthys lucidus TaxID=240159 RepID=A0A4U5UD73_COLLU|nr:Coiled-coil domain-containing protein 142 [Collichthys lucidus]